MTVSTETLKAGLGLTLDQTDFDSLGEKYEGKVRDNYTSKGRRVLVVTDRISAFDRVLGTLPFKGQVLNTVAAFWFDVTKNIAPNHVIDVPDPNVMVGVECQPLEVEMIVRAYLTGVTSTSIWTHYARGERTFCGHRLPEGLRKHERLPEPLLTPSTKAPKGSHDVSASREEILAMGKVSARDFDEAAAYALALFREGQRLCAERGLILVDTKYEFGRTPDGRLVVIDEIHTPDSSRFWYAHSYGARFEAGEDPESFDKEYVRRWLADNGYRGEGTPPRLPDEVRVEAARRYIEACDQVRGTAFVPNTEPPLPRMRRALRIEDRKVS